MTTFPKLNLRTFFIAASAWTFVFLALGTFALIRAWKADPQLIEHLKPELAKANIQFNETDFDLNIFDSAVPLVEKTDQWELPVPAKSFQLKIISGDVEIKQIATENIRIRAAGRQSEKENLRLLTIKENADGELKISQPEQTEGLRLKIEIPKKFVGDFLFKTVSGRLWLENISANELEIKTVSGDVEAKGLDVKHLTTKTVSGGVNLALAKKNDVEVQTTSGQVHLLLPQAKTAAYEIKTISGQVANAFATGGRSTDYVVHVKTVSGDIQIEDQP